MTHAKKDTPACFYLQDVSNIEQSLMGQLLRWGHNVSNKTDAEHAEKHGEAYGLTQHSIVTTVYVM